MFSYEMSVLICMLVGIGICFIEAGNLSLSQDIGVLIIALALGLLCGIIGNLWS